MSGYKYRKTFTVGFTKEGKPIRKDIKTNDRKVFQLKCKQYEQLVSDGVNVVANQQTVEEWAWKWYNTYKKPLIGVSQQKNIDSLLRLHILPHIGSMKIGSVQSYHLQQLMNQQAGKSNSQIQKIRSILTQMFQRAELDRVISYTPASKLYAPKGQEKQRRHLTDDERAALYRVIRGHKANIWIRLMLECGLRRGETIPLRWKDIDFKEGILTVNKAVEYDGEFPRVKLPKTSSGVRHIPIPPSFLKDLTVYKWLRKEKDDHLILYNSAGQIYKQTQTRRLWNSVKRKWDIEMGGTALSKQCCEACLRSKHFSPLSSSHLLH